MISELPKTYLWIYRIVSAVGVEWKSLEVPWRHNAIQRPILIRRVWNGKLMICGLTLRFLINRGKSSCFSIKENWERSLVINLFCRIHLHCEVQEWKHRQVNRASVLNWWAMNWMFGVVFIVDTLTFCCLLGSSRMFVGFTKSPISLRACGLSLHVRGPEREVYHSLSCYPTNFNSNMLRWVFF
jgi:hypothetical protein